LFCIGGIDELGCTKMTMMKINEIMGSVSVTFRPYKTTAGDREVRSEIDSPYASPIILVKQGAKNRLCIDYRRLNKEQFSTARPT